MRALFRSSFFIVVTGLALAACGADAESDADVAAGEPPGEARSAEDGHSGVTVQGFANPESALHDPAADVYLVSNVDGESGAEDGNGFVSRVSPEGEVLEMRWIDGTQTGVTLNAPKGMGLLGDTLIVADLDVVRLFDRESGAPLGAWDVEGANFLNDVAVAPDGTVYVSDTGAGATEEGRREGGASGIHAFSADGSRRALDTGDATGINGLAAVDGRLYGVTTGSGRVFLIEDGGLAELPELPGLRLDGIVTVDEGLLISDWDTETVYLLRDNGSLSAAVRNVETPADIGIDRTRDRLLIPAMQSGYLLLAPLPNGASASAQR